MSLGRRLKAISDGLSAKAPEASAALHGYIEDLRATGIKGRVLKVGESAPDFDLGATLRESMEQRVQLKHHRCYSCFAYGASCSEGV